MLFPPLDTGQPPSAQLQKADPEFSRQPIISVPPEADNRGQTVVSPQKIKLKRDIALPNMVAWADEARPRLDIPDAPLTPAAEIRRMPPVQNAVVSPPPDAAQVNPQRRTPALPSAVVVPPPDLRASDSTAAFQDFQPALIAPPPSVQSAPARSWGAMDIAPSAVIAPAPQLPVAAQRIPPAGKFTAAGTAVVAPPPSVSGTSSSAALGSRGRVIALNLHPAVAAPPESPAGNRRGTFTATPEGHAGASGTPGAGGATGSGTGTNRSGEKKSDLPSGLYVGKIAETTSPVAGSTESGKSAASVNPRLLASARPPTLSTTSAPPGESAARLSEAERTVFAGRRFYSLTLNMPNLNSAGGSWIIRFAEKNREPSRAGGAPPANLSQPMAIRKVDPAYPLQLMRQNVAGTVILYAVIHADGSVGDVRVLRGVDERLDRFAADAVAQWKFQPATKDGSPVDVEATFQIPFRPTRANF
ncbi:MAG TPA: TonB family protein [Candidatus Sulfotelmatobacter sp.]|nr:TonB family protein [Candidatus Sulfotelmatobacter sp.]